MAAQERQGTPGGVAFVAVFAIVVGVFQLAAGALLLIFNDDVDGYSSGEAVIYGLVTLLVGVAYIAVGRGLLRLNPTALFVGLLFSGLRLVYDIVWVIAVGLDGIGFTGLIAAAVNLLVFLALLSGRRAFAR